MIKVYKDACPKHPTIQINWIQSPNFNGPQKHSCKHCLQDRLLFGNYGNYSYTSPWVHQSLHNQMQQIANLSNYQLNQLQNQPVNVVSASGNLLNSWQQEQLNDNYGNIFGVTSGLIENLIPVTSIPSDGISTKLEPPKTFKSFTQRLGLRKK